MNIKKTVYECCKVGKDIAKTLDVIHYADTELEAIAYLMQNGGGVYRNTLHKFTFPVEGE